MAVSIAKLAIQFVADTSGMIAGTKKAESALGGFVGSVKGVGGKLAGAFGFVGAGAALVTFVQTIRKSFKEIDALGDTSKKLGVGVESLQLLGFAAGQSGVETESLNKAIVKMNDTIGEALGGNKKAIETFDALGLKAENLAAKSPEQAFVDIAEALSKLPSQATKTKIGMDVFSKSAAELLPLLSEGRAGIEALFKERGEMGLLSEKDVAGIQAMDDAWNKMSIAIQRVGGEIAVNLAKPMEDFANLVTNTAPLVGQMVRGIGTPSEGNAIQQAAGKVGEAIGGGGADKAGEGISDLYNLVLDAQKDIIKGWMPAPQNKLTPEQIAEIGKEQIAQWAREDKQAAAATMSPLETMAKQMNEQFATGIGGADENLQDFFAGGKDANKLFGKLKKPVVDTVGDLFSTIDRKANAALGSVTGTIGDSAIGNLLDSAQMGMQSFAQASGEAKANIDALSAAPVIGQAAALQRGTAEAFSTARQNAADTQKANEAKEQKSQTKLLEKIEKNTGVSTDAFKTATF